MKILDVENVSKSFGDKIVLENVSFSIDEGKIIGLVGPNGIGKTTIMKMISGLLLQDSGSIKVCGITINEDRLKYLSNLSCIIETPSLYEELSGLDNLNFIGRLNNVPINKINDIISFVNIKDSINLKVSDYSLGMKQRLALGIALLTNPKLLILDEPTNGLDPEGVLNLRETLKNISQEFNTSILISSHILSELDKICDKILFVKDKKILEADMLRDMINYQTIILSSNDSNTIINQLQKVPIIKKIWIKNNKVYIRVKKADIVNIFTVLSQNKISFDNAEMVNDSSENYYEELYFGGNNESIN